MKTTELMIGDWVLMDMNYSEENPMYAKFDYRPYQITSGEDIDLACETNCIGDDSIYLPIPLTKEILEMNGFTHCVTTPCGYYHAPVCDMFDILFHASEDSYEDTWHTEVFTDHNDNNFVLFNICYTHELQHALRLCGLNELADNLKLEE